MNMGILVTVEKANHQSLMKDGQSPHANRTISCQLSHQELPTTKSFLYHQTVQLEQSEVRLPVTECGKRCRVIDCEMCLFGQTNLRKAWWTETQNHVEVIENILQGHLLRSHYPPTEKEEHTIYSRIFRRIHIVNSAGARKLRELIAEGIQKTRVVTCRARENLVIDGPQITKSSMKKGGRDRNIGMPTVVQDLATQWLQSYHVRTKNSQETTFGSSLNLKKIPKWYTQTTHWNLSKLVKPCLEPLYIDTAPNRDQWCCRKSIKKSLKMYFHCSRTVWIG